MNVLSCLSLLVAGISARRNDYSDRALQDEITTLPGLSSNDMEKYSMFSGYITVNETNQRKLFYWFVESLNDPANDPVALWTNGGPGCSGLGGFFTEQGPFRVNEDYSLYINNYSWVNVANMVFIEQPSGVGFSYSLTVSDYTTGDNRSASDNYEFIKQWLTVFDNYQSNDFYITSESYGGHYMPTLAKEIVKGQAAGDSPTVNFKGLFVGNPYTDPEENAKGQYDTWFGHSLTSLPTFQEYYKKCGDGSTTDRPECIAAEVKMNEEIGDLDPYALDFPVCPGRNLSVPMPAFFDFATYSEKFWFLKKVLKEGLGRPMPAFYERKFKEYDQHMNLVHPNNRREFLKQFEEFVQAQLDFSLKYPLESSKKSLNQNGTATTSEPFDFPPDSYEPCESNWMTVYLNRKDVQNAIHARNTTTWTMCSFTLNYSSADTQVPMEPYYTWLVENDASLHITVISGDDDSVCGTIGTQSWIWNMGWTVRENVNWQAWYLDDQVAGYRTQWTNNVSFVTVHSAGHMIPETQPKRSLAAFTKYLAGTF